MPHTYLPDLPGRAEVPERGILSRILHDDGRLRLVLFAFDAGQQLTEHTAGVPVVRQAVSGCFEVTAGGERFDLRPDGWLLLDAHEAHSLVAREPARLLLTMLPPG